MEKKLFRKFMEFGIGSVITLLLGFISSPIVTRIISPEENGKFSMFNTVTNLLLVIVMLGLDQTYVRYYYEEEENSRETLLRKCIKIPLIINIFIGIVIIIFYKPISMYVVQEHSLMITILLVVNLLLSIISRFAMLEIRMRQRAKLYSLLNVIMKIANLIFVIGIFFIYKNSYMTLVIAMILTNIIVTAIAIIVEKDQWFSNKQKVQLKTSTNEIVKYGIPLIFSMAITWIFQSIDRVAIKEFSGYAEVGLYSGAMTIVALLNAVQATFTTFWTPVAFERYSLEPDNKEFFTKINKIVSVVMIFIAIGLIASKDIIVLLLGAKYREAVFIFPYLVFMPIMFTISETTVIGINFKKKPKYHIYIAIISAIVNLIGNLILVPKMGAKGAAIATGLAYIVFFVVRTYFSTKYYKVDYNLGKFAISTVLTYILATYSSFYRFNFVILILTIVDLTIIGFLYRDVFIEVFNILRTRKNKSIL
ncbi:lipopolysaccharide biosynthesis protein [Clostridium gasigenes]|uniref:lipopolysaccharide biosynthesis protein n=1 Tax=Clostridium gasigenes TaxID=94869 RepID=UPI001C0E2C8D|nr:oligosaccharide flippase family protein [Clostridium gasigenes]MBU3107650.1 oligosaccharide flippase family protein [Clostridium gasigenes]